MRAGAMKRGINFGSIFGRKDGDQAPPPSDQTDHAALAQRLLGRSIKLVTGELEPVSSDSPPLDWDAVDGQITIPAEVIEGMLEGRARVRAIHIKRLSPPPLGAETPDQSEYVVSLPAVIPQIQDLLGSSGHEPGPEAEWETPFAILAKQDEARFAEQTNRQTKEKPREQLKSGLVQFPERVAAPEESLSTQEPGREEKEAAQEEQVPNSLNAEPPVLTLRTLRPAPGPQSGRTQAPANPLDAEDNTTLQRETENTEPEQSEPKNNAAGQMTLSEMQTANPDPSIYQSAVTPLSSRRWDGDTSRAGRGTGLLQEIFMTSEPLDGRRVASLVRQFPGVTGALILLEGGAVLGGQLPESLNTEAALQAPEVLGKFLRFISEVEDGSVSPRFVTVTSSDTISLTSSGQVVLLVTHQGRKLPPGLPQRLTETAQALDLIYGKKI
jgi:hypothetical protein